MTNPESLPVEAADCSVDAAVAGCVEDAAAEAGTSFVPAPEAEEILFVSAESNPAAGACVAGGGARNDGAAAVLPVEANDCEGSWSAAEGSGFGALG